MVRLIKAYSTGSSRGTHSTATSCGFQATAGSTLGNNAVTECSGFGRSTVGHLVPVWVLAVGRSGSLELLSCFISMSAVAFCGLVKI